MNNSVEENAFKATLELIKVAKVKINGFSLKNALLSHSDFPSLASISNVLDEFNVPNLATKLSQEQLLQIPLPALAHINSEGGSFVMITAISEGYITWKHNILENTKELITDFAVKWDGITLLIEPNEASGEPEYQELRKKTLIENFRVPFIITGLLAGLLFLIKPILIDYSISENWQLYGLIFSKLLGTALSIMLVWYSLDSNNSFLNKICQLNKKTNCHNILSSEAANIAGVVSWSDVGLIYFLGGLLSLLFFQKNTIPIHQIISLLALPYTFWSIYHQAFKAKTWCPLCICVQILLWVEFIISFPISVKIVSGDSYIELSLCFLIVAALLALVKKHFVRSFQKEALNIEIQKLKFNPDFVESLFSKETILPPFDSRIKLIELGNPLAEFTFKLVLNPTCGACRQKFLDIEKIVANNEEINYQIILSSSSQNDETSNQVTRNILGLGKNTLKIEALHDWFKNETQNIITWQNKWKNQEEISDGELQRRLHRQWLDEAGITYVPVTYLNNTKIPINYSAKEAVKLLKYYSTVGFRNQ